MILTILSVARSILTSFGPPGLMNSFPWRGQIERSVLHHLRDRDRHVLLQRGNFTNIRPFLATATPVAYRSKPATLVKPGLRASAGSAGAESLPLE